MDKIRIRGGKPLHGSITVGGAKNAALPMLAATLLTSEERILNKVPDLSDVRTMEELIHSLGVKIEFDPARHRVRVRAKQITSSSAPPELVGKMRASFLVAGPLLARILRTRS